MQVQLVLDKPKLDIVGVFMPLVTSLFIFLLFYTSDNELWLRYGIPIVMVGIIFSLIALGLAIAKSTGAGTLNTTANWESIENSYNVKFVPRQPEGRLKADTHVTVSGTMEGQEDLFFGEVVVEGDVARLLFSNVRFTPAEEFTQTVQNN